jgi:hypothetical protein
MVQQFRVHYCWRPRATAVVRSRGLLRSNTPLQQALDRLLKHK